MTNNINSYIDHNIIDEHAFKSFRIGYSLDVSEMPSHDLENFLDFLLQHDPVTKEIVLERMQVLVDSRLPIKECEARYSAGYVPSIDHINGETMWTAKRGYCHE